MGKLRFYAKLAALNIKNNRAFYIPYILTGMGCTLMLYIITFLLMNEGLEGSFGGGTIGIFLQFGFYIIIIFSVIVLFYTNSFLMKRRKNELGLFIILGMERRHLGGVQFFESIIVAFISIAGGFALGVGFSALTMNLLTRLAHISTPLLFSIDLKAFLTVLAVFLATYFAILLYNLTIVGRARPIELLKGTATGEKEPKSKWLLAILGTLALGGGYMIALLVDNPMDAIFLFFIAVILVITGTYLLFTSGSVAILKSLRNNKKYYYKTNRFINVSGMIYRMKQNAVGLGNICILSTMVLVMVSATVALYVGVEDSLDEQYAGDFIIGFDSPSEGLEYEASAAIQEYTAEEGFGTTGLDYSRFIGLVGQMNSSGLELVPHFSGGTDAVSITVISASEYTRKTGDEISLSDGDTLSHFKDARALENLKLFDINLESRGSIDNFPVSNIEESYTSGLIRLVVSDADFYRLNAACIQNSDMYSNNLLQVYFDMTGFTDEDSQGFISGLYNHIASNVGVPYVDENSGEGNESFAYSYYRSRATESENLYSMYGGLLFLGISLGIMFMMATILIIYYKQITEGYNDRERFIIMQKVGLSKDEIRSSIRSQIVMVFFLPLIAAVIHVAFAFNIITELLAVLLLTDIALYLLCTAGAIAVFAVVYLIIYFLTAREYYKIVSR